MSYIIPVFINYAGCPQRCAFCNQQRINRQEDFSVAAINSQIEKHLAFLPAAAPKELAFYGGSFTGLPEQVQEELLQLAATLRGQGIIEKIRLSTRPDYIDQKTVERLLHYGVGLVELGVQSLDDNVLQLAKRGHDAAAVMIAANLLQQAGISFGIQLMLGLPEQDWQSIIDTTSKVIEFKPSVTRIYPLLIFADTDFAKDLAAQKFVPLDLETAVAQAAYMVEEFEQADIKVIRLGLQDDDGLREAGSVLAGPYHPAFGELVAAHRYRKFVSAKLESISKGQTIELSLPKRKISQIYGHKKANLAYWRNNYPQQEIIFTVTDSEHILLKIKNKE